MPFDDLPIDGELSREAVDLRRRFNELCEGGTSADDPTLAGLEMDNLAVALAFGIRGVGGRIGAVVAKREEND
jgi:hypothetical protein